MRRQLPLSLLVLLAGCRDSPREVMEEATQAAALGQIVEVQQAFTATTVQRLEHAWDLEHKRATDGWEELCGKLRFDRKPLEIRGEEIFGDYAKVEALAGVQTRAYYLRKEDGHWRIELGAELAFNKAKAAEKKSEAPPSEAPAGKGDGP